MKGIVKPLLIRDFSGSSGVIQPLADIAAKSRITLAEKNKNGITVPRLMNEEMCPALSAGAGTW